MWENPRSDQIEIHRQAPTSHNSHPCFRAGNGTRTRDPNLGKVVLYQLSYSRDEMPFMPSTVPKDQQPALAISNKQPADTLGLTESEHGGEGNRTPDLLNAIQALSQLSYAPGALKKANFQEPESVRRGRCQVKQITLAKHVARCIFIPALARFPVPNTALGSCRFEASDRSERPSPYQRLLRSLRTSRHA